jgi:heat shock protein HslJ
MKTKILVILIIFIVLIACNKDDEANVDNLYHSWEAKRFMSVESVAYPKNEGKKIGLKFFEDGTYGLSLDINGCGGTYKVNENRMEISSVLCTLICCDSKFSEKLSIMLPKVTTYEISGKTLKLNVPHWGYIEFELAE